MSSSAEYPEYLSGPNPPVSSSTASLRAGVTNFDYYWTERELSSEFFVNGTGNSSGDGTAGVNYLDDPLEGGVTTASWLLLILLSSMIVLTIVGNALVCLAVILVRKLRKPQNYLLVSLATSDLFVALFVMPFAIVAEFHENRWPLNHALCDLYVSVDVLCCTASILNLCGISVDRYRAITSPLEYSAKTSPKRMLAVIFCVWLGSACVSLPPLLLLGNEHFDVDNSTIPICTVSQNFWYQIYATMVSFYVPLFVMVVVYVKILRVVADKKKEMGWKHRPSALIPAQQPSLTSHNNSGGGGPTTENSVLVNVSVNVRSGKSHKSRVKLATAANGGPPSQQLPPESGPGGYIFPTTTLHRLKKEKLLGGLREHKASTTLGIIMSAFIICWLPFFVLALVRPFCTKFLHVEIPSWISSLFLWLGYANSALNPVIYATLNRDFRRPFKEILCFRCSTLDTLMRREFYNHQFGEDTENLRFKQQCRDEADVPTNL